MWDAIIAHMLHAWPFLIALYWALGVTAAFVAYRLDHSAGRAIHAALIGIVWPWALAACVVAALVRLIEARH